MANSAISGGSAADPPPFQDAANCGICNCTFNVFRRKHHCRSCGKTVCGEHSSNTKVLPQFGMSTPVRVCDTCFEMPSIDTSLSREQSASNLETTLSDAEPLETENEVRRISTRTKADAVVASLRLTNDVRGASDSSDSQASAIECRCHMPLCICEPVGPPREAPAAQVVPAPRLRRAGSVTGRVKTAGATEQRSAPEQRAPTNPGMPSLFFTKEQSNTSSTTQTAPQQFEPNGEGMKDAVKANDVEAVKKLLEQGTDPRYCDKQGMTLLHVASVFNRTEIVNLLMDAGADPTVKNAQAMAVSSTTAASAWRLGIACSVRSVSGS
ncbi:hypothetical protein CBR_g36802 [Chara braunii]|uniref:FYVE-type domain-containing protein n=1 Tax=Chara braunii TaxID=69332 RepID=A0A388LLH0_CHABU|nr:hypothetical protein CBR_g36802 [Chara braunii]|eukprot:GBG83186.1 hypothetical protein CBR_g36802 [Chara braunii]